MKTFLTKNTTHIALFGSAAAIGLIIAFPGQCWVIYGAFMAAMIILFAVNIGDQPGMNQAKK